MKKIIKRLNYLLIGSLVAGSTAAIFSTQIVNLTKQSDSLNNTSLSNAKSSKFSASTFALTNNTNDVTTTTNNIVEPMITSTGDISLETPLQYYAADTASNSGFAELTNSTTTKGEYDQITKYSATGNTAGKADWIVKKTDLGNLISVTTASELTIKSIVYSHGSLEQPAALFVLVQSTNATNSGSYLFKIIWSGTDKGKYDLVQKVSNGTSDVYNYLEVINARQILALAVPKFTNTTVNTSYALKFAFINSTQSSNTIPATSNSITIDSSLLSSLAENAFMTNIFKIPSTGIYYLVMQGDSDSTKANKAISIINLGALSTTDKTISGSNNLINLDLSSYYKDGVLTSESNKYLKSHLIDVGNSNYAIVLSQKKTAASAPGKYLVSTFNLQTSFGSSTPFSTKVISNYPNTGSYFINIRPLYQVGSRTPYAYVAIDSSNIAVRLDINLSYETTLFNFSSATFNLGSIYNVYTRTSDSSWYAQMTDQTFAQMNNGTLVGQWDKLAQSTNSLEVPAVVSIKDASKVLDGALFQQVANASNNGYATSFDNYMSASDAYLKFLDVNFTDPRLGSRLPSISITKSAFAASSNRTYSITLTFKQSLRQLDANGNVLTGSTPQEINLGSATFNFINGNATAIPANDVTQGFSVPSFLLSTLPSKITAADVQRYLFKTSNISNATFTLTPDDRYGILNVSIDMPYAWINGSLVTNRSLFFTFGTQASPYFATNPLAQQDTSVTLYTQEYLNANTDILNSLTVKYAGTLPSNISKRDAISDFVAFGGAFSNPTNSSIISTLTDEDIEVVPLNNKGSLFISFTFRRLGNQTNVKYSFETGSVFKKDASALDAVFFVFKENQVVLNTDADGNPLTPERLQDYRPSQLVPGLIQTSNQQSQLDQLKLYADFSSYFDKLLFSSTTGVPQMTISATANDPSGLLTITITLANPLPNSDTTVIKQTFSGFGTSGSVIGSPSSFSFQSMPGSLLGKSPSDVTVEELISNNVLAIAGATANLAREITLEPINESGTLGVKVIFYNWVELTNGVTSIVPVKEFNRVYTGFPITKPPINAVIWKSFDELDDAFKSLTPSNIVTSVQGTYPEIWQQANFWANLSTSLRNYLFDNPQQVEISYTPNNAVGTLGINLKINGLEGESSINTFATTISGFQTTDILSPSIIWTNDEDESIQNLKPLLPSQLTSDQIGLFYNVVDSSQFTKVVNSLTNDVDGSVLLEVILTPSSGTSESFTFQRLFSGFQKNIPEYRSTDWGLIAILGGSALAIFLIPTITLVLLRNLYTKKKIVRRLDTRLDEERKRQNKEKPISSIKDLVD